MNLWEETKQALNRYNKTFDDVLVVCGNDFQISKKNFEEVAKRIDYYEGYGGQEVASDLRMIGKDFIFLRGEYDGSEWWEFMSLETPKNTSEIKFLKKDTILDNTLMDMNT